MQVVTLPALGTGRPYLPGNITGTDFCRSTSRPQGHSAVGRIMSMKNFNEPTGNRTRDFPACSAVPQSTVPPLSSMYKYVHVNSTWFVSSFEMSIIILKCLRREQVCSKRRNLNNPATCQPKTPEHLHPKRPVIWNIANGKVYLRKPLEVQLHSFLNSAVDEVSCQVWVFSCQLSVVSCKSSAVSCQLSAVSCQSSAVSCQLSDVSRQLSVVSRQLSVVNCQLSVVSCRLSVVNCQLSVVSLSCQMSVVSCQLSIVSCQSSVVSCQVSA